MGTHRRRQVVLRCYARPLDSSADPGRYIAVCLTLNLIVEGRSLRESIHKLHALIKAYIDDAAAKDEFDAFVPRRAPARFYAEYVVCSAVHAFARVVTHTRPRFCAFTDRHPIPAHG